MPLYRVASRLTKFYFFADFSKKLLNKGDLSCTFGSPKTVMGDLEFSWAMLDFGPIGVENFFKGVADHLSVHKTFVFLGICYFFYSGRLHKDLGIARLLSSSKSIIL